MTIEEKQIEKMRSTYLRLSENNKLNILLEIESFFDGEITESIDYFNKKKINSKEITEFKQLLFEAYRVKTQQVFIQFHSSENSFWIALKNILLKEINLKPFQFNNVYKIYRLGPQLKILREKQNVSVLELAERTGMSKRLINELEKDGRNISFMKLIKYFNKGLLIEIPMHL